MANARVHVALGVLTACALSLAGPPLAGAKPKQQDRGLPLPEVQSWQLENGLTVALAPLSRGPLVSVQVWYRAGSKDEPPDRRGTARLLRTLAFEGSERVRPGAHRRFITDLGGTVDSLTTEDATFYQNTVPSDHLDFALRLEAERMQNLLIREPAVKEARSRLAAELRRQERGPLAAGFARFLEVAFTRHPYRWTSRGVRGDIEKITPADLQAFYDRYYTPNNALVVIAGDVSEEAAKRAVKEQFGSIPRGEEPPRPSDEREEPAQEAPRRKVLAPSSIGFVLAGYRIPAAKQEDVNALQLLSLLLTAGESSRLHQRLVVDAGVAQQTGGQAMVREDPGLFIALAAYRDPANSEKVEGAMLAELARLRDKRLTSKEVQRAQNQLLSTLLFGMESASGLAGSVGQSWILTGDPSHFVRDLKEVDAMSPADLRQVAGEYLVDKNLTVVVIPPRGAGR